MLYVRASYRLGMLAVISYNYRDRWIELSNAVNQILKLVITNKCFCSNCDKLAYVVFYTRRKVYNNETQSLKKKKNILCALINVSVTSSRSSRSSIIEFRNQFMSDFDGEGCLEAINRKLHWFIYIKKIRLVVHVSW